MTVCHYPLNQLFTIIDTVQTEVIYKVLRGIDGMTSREPDEDVFGNVLIGEISSSLKKLSYEELIQIRESLKMLMNYAKTYHEGINE